MSEFVPPTIDEVLAAIDSLPTDRIFQGHRLVTFRHLGKALFHGSTTAWEKAADGGPSPAARFLESLKFESERIRHFRSMNIDYFGRRAP